MAGPRARRRTERMEERLARLDALIGAMEVDREPGPFWRVLEQIERELVEDPPGPLAEVERVLTDLQVDEEDLPGQERAGTLRLALAIQRELGRRLPLDLVLGVVPGLSGSLVEKALLLPLSIGLANAWRLRSDPQGLARRARRLQWKRDRLARRLQAQEEPS